MTRLDIPLRIVNTSYLLKVEEILSYLENPDHIRNLREKSWFTPNRTLLNDVVRHKPDEDHLTLALGRYYDETLKHMTSRLRTILRPDDSIISQNYLYPYLPRINNASIFYYIDALLTDFFFDRKNGVLLDLFPIAARSKVIHDFYRSLETNALEASSGVFSFSQALKTMLRKQFDINQIEVTGAGINFPTFPKFSPKLSGRVFKLLFVGLDFARKGGSYLLDAMEKLDPERVRLTIVTDRSSFNARRQQQHVKWLPFQSKAKLSPLYRSADLFVFPTLFEPFGLVVCEAMAHSLPVLTSNHFAMSEITGPKNLPYLLRQITGDNLANRIRKMMDDKELRNELQLYNYNRAKRLFQWKRVVRTILSKLWTRP